MGSALILMVVPEETLGMASLYTRNAEGELVPLVERDGMWVRRKDVERALREHPDAFWMLPVPYDAAWRPPEEPSETEGFDWHWTPEVLAAHRPDKLRGEWPERSEGRSACQLHPPLNAEPQAVAVAARLAGRATWRGASTWAALASSLSFALPTNAPGRSGAPWTAGVGERTRCLSTTPGEATAGAPIPRGARLLTLRPTPMSPAVTRPTIPWSATNE